jgi:hypothetical protein
MPRRQTKGVDILGRRAVVDKTKNGVNGFVVHWRRFFYCAEIDYLLR